MAGILRIKTYAEGQQSTYAENVFLKSIHSFTSYPAQCTQTNDHNQTQCSPLTKAINVWSVLGVNPIYTNIDNIC